LLRRGKSAPKIERGSGDGDRRSGAGEQGSGGAAADRAAGERRRKASPGRKSGAGRPPGIHIDPISGEPENIDKA